MWTKPKRLSALAVTLAFGAIAGMTYSFNLFLFTVPGVAAASFRNSGEYFLLWLTMPDVYWPWAVLGAAMSGLAASARILWRT